MKRKNSRKKKGFTLVELIAVIAILGILAAIVVPKIGGYTDKANKAKAQADAKTVIQAIELYNANADVNAQITDDKKGSEIKDKLTLTIPNFPKELENLTVQQIRGIADGSVDFSFDGTNVTIKQQTTSGS